MWPELREEVRVAEGGKVQGLAGREDSRVPQRWELRETADVGEREVGACRRPRGAWRQAGLRPCGCRVWPERRHDAQGDGGHTPPGRMRLRGGQALEHLRSRRVSDLGEICDAAEKLTFDPRDEAFEADVGEGADVLVLAVVAVEPPLPSVAGLHLLYTNNGQDTALEAIESRVERPVVPGHLVESKKERGVLNQVGLGREVEEGRALCTEVEGEPGTGDVEGAKVCLKVWPARVVELAARE